jgi:hypothetical protein
MRFYKIDCIGKIWLQRLAVPVWAAADEGRLLYDTGDNVMFLGDNAGFGEVWTERNDGPGSGLDADLLDGEEGTEFHRADLLNAGFIPAARLAGQTYNITNLGNAATATTAKYA